MSDNKVRIRTLKKKSLETLPENRERRCEVRCAGRLFHRLAAKTGKATWRIE